MIKKNFASFLFWIFVIISLVLFSYIAYVERGFVQDGISHFDRFLEFAEYDVVTNYALRMRYFSCMILQLPMAVARFGLNIESREILSRIFSFSLVFLPFLTIFWNLFLSRRTKRYDIFVCSVILYTIGILPFSYYAVVEFFVSVSLYLVLLHYLISKLEYKTFDIILILLLSIFLFNSHEFVGFFGFVLFFWSIYCFKDKNLSIKTRIIKLLVGVSGLLSGILFWFFYLTPNGPNIQGDGGLSDFTFSVTSLPQYITYKGCVYLNLFLLTSLLFCFFFLYRKKVNKVISFSMVLLYAVVLFFEVNRFSQDVSFYHISFINLSIICRFTGAIVFLFILLYLLLFDFIEKNKYAYDILQNKIHNIFILTLIVGISTSFIQIYFSKVHGDLMDDFSNQIEKCPFCVINPFEYPREEELSMVFLPEFYPLMSLHILNKDGKVDKLILATNDDFIIRKHCYSKSEKSILIYAFGDNNTYYTLDDEESTFNFEPVNNYFKKRKFYCKK